MGTRAISSGSDRGAVLVHTALALLALVAFTTFVVDFGTLWLARRQAQNSADAGAFAGGIELLTDLTAEPAARDAADGVAKTNLIYGAQPYIDPPNHITFPNPGDAGCPSWGIKCIQVDVFRDQASGNPLPIFFGQLVGLSQQGTKATATVVIANGDAADCIRPFAIPQRRDPATGVWDPYTFPDDIGETLVLSPKAGGQYDSGWFQLLDIVDDGKAGGANETKASIRSCLSNRYGLNDPLPTEMGEEASIRTAIEDLIALDPSANVGGGPPPGLQNSCATGNPPVGCYFYNPDGTKRFESNPLTSPRVIPVPIFDPDIYAATGDVILVDIFGFFLLPPVGPGKSGQEISGIILTYPGVRQTGSTGGGSGFLLAMALSR